MSCKTDLFSPVEIIKGVGKKYSQILSKKGIEKIIDLLHYFPIYYIDFSKPADELKDYEAVYEGKIIGVSKGRNFRRRFSIIKITIKLFGEKVGIVFFNKPYLLNSMNTNGKLRFYGLIEDDKKNGLTIVNPIIANDEINEILPIYKNIGTIKQGIISKLIKNALEVVENNYEILPEFLLEKYNFEGLNDSFKMIHQPKTFENIENLKERFIYTEFLIFQLELQYLRRILLKNKRMYKYNLPCEFDTDVNKRLPFALTRDQKKIFLQIKEELQKASCLSGLLQGDVGSGKTIIAFLSIFAALFNGYQAAILVPTEVLAFQHKKKAEEFFKGYEIEVLTGSNSVSERKEIIRRLAKGEISLIIGTHSIINEEVVFKKLSMIIIDEQHKFGVTQRAALFYKNKGIDLLVMTATPIPRTMLLAIYKDLKVFAIKQKPANRKEIKTKIIPNRERLEFYLWLKRNINENKVYIILPLIEKSDYFEDLLSIEGESAFFKKLFKTVGIGIISGKTDKSERDEILKGFKESRYRVILSTTVIEVGIDVEDATIIVIEDADRYGLSGLHQLRGRVGRGNMQSYCYLIPSKRITDSGKERLKTIERENDGFKIAEIDLKMRGGGIIAGLNQSGDINFRFGQIEDYYSLFENARDDATILLKNENLLNNYLESIVEKIKIKNKLINFS